VSKEPGSEPNMIMLLLAPPPSLSKLRNIQVKCRVYCLWTASDDSLSYMENLLLVGNKKAPPKQYKYEINSHSLLSK
jgi:hypothetical protein